MSLMEGIHPNAKGKLKTFPLCKTTSMQNETMKSTCAVCLHPCLDFWGLLLWSVWWNSGFCEMLNHKSLTVFAVCFHISKTFLGDIFSRLCGFFLSPKTRMLTCDSVTFGVWFCSWLCDEPVTFLTSDFVSWDELQSLKLFCLKVSENFLIIFHQQPSLGEKSDPIALLHSFIVFNAFENTSCLTLCFISRFVAQNCWISGWPLVWEKW